MAGCESRRQVIALLVSLLIIPVQVQIVFSDQNFGKLPIAELGFSLELLSSSYFLARIKSESPGFYTDSDSDS